MEFLLQRPSGYYFRLTTPPDLKSIIGTREIKRSLQTGSLCLAKERAFLISATLIDELTGHATQGETPGRYGKRYTAKVLYDEVVLKLGYGIDLVNLKGSKWVL